MARAGVYAPPPGLDKSNQLLTDRPCQAPSRRQNGRAASLARSASSVLAVAGPVARRSPRALLGERRILLRDLLLVPGVLPHVVRRPFHLGGQGVERRGAARRPPLLPLELLDLLE